MADNETIADIIRKIRAEADSIEASVRGSLKVEEGLNGMPFTESDLEPALDLVMTKRKKADRLEAAWKREKATTEKSSTVGDAAKLRVALLRCDAIAQLPEVRNEQSIKDMRNIIRQALAAPPRNCDVGTAEEQTRRMEAEYCHVQKSCYESPSGRECPLHKAEVDCRLIWAQMPYKKGGAK